VDTLSESPALGHDHGRRAAVTWIALDRDSSTAALIHADDTATTLPLGVSPFSAGSALTRIGYSFSHQRMVLETRQGDSVVIEMPVVGAYAPINGRPVIYLDQKDWSTLANALHTPDKVKVAAECAAAMDLITLAQRREIILPVSAAHLSETGRFDSQRRYLLGLTIAQLSAGWQMRDPLEVRRHELRQSFSRIFQRSSPLPMPVFTLEPYAIHGPNRTTRRPQWSTDLPEDLAVAMAALTSMTSYIDTILDAAPVKPPPDSRWRDKNQRFTGQLASLSDGPARKRDIIRGFFIVDTEQEIAEEAARSGLTQTDLYDWVQEHRDTALDTLPSLGLYRGVLEDKHLNPDTRWKVNDLADLMYLTCGAGYADYVVGERSMVSHLRNASRRLGRPCTAYRSLQELVTHLTQTS
jgi:hypothetical protein